MKEQFDNGTVFECALCQGRGAHDSCDVMIGDVRFCYECAAYDGLAAIARLVNPRYSRICAERNALLEFYKNIMASANDTGRDTTLTAWAADQMMRSSLSVYESVSHPLRVAMDEVKQ